MATPMVANETDRERKRPAVETTGSYCVIKPIHDPAGSQRVDI